MTDLRSGLCHGPDCEAEITDGSESEDFCGDDCQTRWNASHADPPMPPLSINLPGPSLARWTPEGGAPVTPETSTWEPTRVSWVPTIADPEHPTTAELMGGMRLDGFPVEGAPTTLRPGVCGGVPEECPIRETCPVCEDNEAEPPNGWVQLDDTDHPDWAWTDVSEYVSDTHGLERRSTVALRMTPVPPTIHAAPGEPEHLLPGDRFRVEQVGGRWQYKIVEVGEAATQSPIGFSAMLADLDEGICIECGRLRYEHRGVNCRPPARDHRSWLSRLWRWMWLRG